MRESSIEGCTRVAKTLVRQQSGSFLLLLSFCQDMSHCHKLLLNASKCIGGSCYVIGSLVGEKSFFDKTPVF